jgi:putative lipoprotein
LLAIPAGLIACTTAPNEVIPESAPPRETSFKKSKMPPLTAFVFECEDGRHFVAAHEGPDQIVLFLEEGTLRLDRTVSASGTKYSGEQTAFWSKGSEALLYRYDRPPVTCREDRRRSVIESAKLRGVDFWATGNEPGWTLEIDPDSIHMITSYGLELFEFEKPEPRIDQRGRQTVYQAANAEHELEIMIRGEVCTDSMSGESFEVTVELTLDGVRYRGCGQALH